MDNQNAPSPFARISLPPWMNNALHKVMQDGQACVKSMSSQLHKLGCPPRKDGVNAKPTKGREPKALDFKAKLAKQLQAWRENNEWVDTSPKIEVTVPKGTLCNLKAIVQVGLPPDAVFDIVIDPENKRVFKNIKEVTYRKVLEDDGYRQLVEVEQAAMWRFLWWSGTIAVRVYVDQDRRNHIVRFHLAKEGFMKKFEGRWKLEPIFVDEEVCTISKPSTLEEYELCSRGKGRVASLIKLEQLVQPALLPPPPISWYVRGITARTTEMLVEDLQAEVKRLREGLIPSPLITNEGKLPEAGDASRHSI
ncbi:hypothetical protein SUGI_0389910 [Cryptomeria japonica]|uniref:uncharacterized protein LOC131063578 n=1 Tax=Cryptomeria japonica TaxID=3369 RepID=UPI002408E628|nr:uncharacterized protein LOC131063578 [Cryptomeria japonica]GLJ21247.1 hypothetical protein SUGI_0389910 [Cryptomeria japonica]